MHYTVTMKAYCRRACVSVLKSTREPHSVNEHECVSVSSRMCVRVRARGQVRMSIYKCACVHVCMSMRA